MPVFASHIHHKIYYFALILVVVSLPFSIFLLSVAQIILTLNWIAEGNFHKKWEIAKHRPSLWIIVLFYLVHLLWMLNTSDLDWGMHDLKIKLPMLIIPLVIGTSEVIPINKLKTILSFYILAVLAASFLSAYYIFGFDGKSSHTIWEYSRFVSHITWSLMVVTAIFITFWLALKAQRLLRWLFGVTCLWLIIYLFVLQILTGITIFILTLNILLIWTIFHYHHLMLRWFLLIILLTIFILTSNYLVHSYARFHNFDKLDPATLERYTANGSPYSHDIKSKLVENGHYVNIYICESELETSWNLRSKLTYSGLTYNGEELKRTLSRYLTSKGLRKDSAGISKLTDSEIRFIEHGKTNYLDTIKYSLNPRLYIIWWELYNYKNGVSPTGYSVAQRLESLKTAFHIIKKQPWFGVGTGDIPDAFAMQYDSDNSTLSIENRIRTHNQFVTFAVTFGMIGFLIAVISLIIPPFIENKFSSYLFFVVFTIELLSFINEDTLETHQGISLFAFFYFLFLFSEGLSTTGHQLER